MQDQLENGLELIIQFDKRGGLVPVVVQDAASMQILMLAYANKEAVDTTMKTGYATFWSTSRKELWTKGLTSDDLFDEFRLRNTNNPLKLENTYDWFDDRVDEKGKNLVKFYRPALCFINCTG